MTQVQKIPLSQLHESPHNVRKSYGDLSEMAKSIEKQGIIEPIIVRRRPAGGFETIAGHRRARASKLAGARDIDAIVRDLDDQQALELMLTENTERESLHVLELAAGYQRLMEEFSLTGEQAAERIGLKKATFYNVVSLLQLTEPVKKALQLGKVSPSVAYQLVRVRGDRLQAQALGEVLKLAKNGEQPAFRVVERLVRTRYLAEAKRSVAQKKRYEREDQEHGADVALRRRVVERLVHARIPELIARKPALEPVDLRLVVLALAETQGESARDVFQRRGERVDRLASVGGSQLRTLAAQLAFAAWAQLEDGEYSPAVKALAKAYGLSLSEMEKSLAAEGAAEALFKKE